MKLTDKISGLFSASGATIKSLVKLLTQSRRNSISFSEAAREGRPLIILGNGPSLRKVIDENLQSLSSATTMAVNFAANAQEFTSIRPDFYILADPHFFSAGGSDPNVEQLFKNLNELVEWPMTLYIPTGIKGIDSLVANPKIKVERFNFVGIEGYDWFENMSFKLGLGMPRPRNVLVPAIMVGILAGFTTIYLAGADHSWLATLSVTEDNQLVSIQPHFYKDNKAESDRVASVYKDVRLHDMLQSMQIAFRSYHRIEKFARSQGVKVYNATPGSFIDAFRRKNPF